MIAVLQSEYGIPKPPPTTDPWEMIVWENIVYLADDELRAKAFSELKRKVGLRPRDILACRRETLVSIASNRGILAGTSADKLMDAADVAMDEWNGDLRPILKRPLAEAKKALKRFPGIGDPGAEKILLFTRAQPVLALDSNGLRVLLRLGFGEEKRNYSATYKSVREHVEASCRRDLTWLIRAHQLLRRHGQEKCRRSEPLCGECPLVRECAFYAANRRRYATPEPERRPTKSRRRPT
jgi:endonuclease III